MTGSIVAKLAQKGNHELAAAFDHAAANVNAHRQAEIPAQADRIATVFKILSQTSSGPA